MGGTVKDHKAPVHVATLLFFCPFLLFLSSLTFMLPPPPPPPPPPLFFLLFLHPVCQSHTSTHTQTVDRRGKGERLVVQRHSNMFHLLSAKIQKMSASGQRTKLDLLSASAGNLDKSGYTGAKYMNKGFYY